MFQPVLEPCDVTKDDEQTETGQTQTSCTLITRRLIIGDWGVATFHLRNLREGHELNLPFFIL